MSAHRHTPLNPFYISHLQNDTPNQKASTAVTSIMNCTFSRPRAVCLHTQTESCSSPAAYTMRECRMSLENMPLLTTQVLPQHQSLRSAQTVPPVPCKPEPIHTGLTDLFHMHISACFVPNRVRQRCAHLLRSRPLHVTWKQRKFRPGSDNSEQVNRIVKWLRCVL